MSAIVARAGSVLFIAAAALAALVLSCMDTQGSQDGPAGGSRHPETKGLKLPDGFSIGVFADGLDGPRLMAFGPSGVLHVTQTRKSSVLALPDADGDGVSDRKVTVASRLDNPHGIAFFKGHVYIAGTERIVRFTQEPGSLLFADKEVLVRDLPTEGGGHFTRTVVFGPDEKMYVSVGSSCNVCVEDDRRRAAVLRFDPDGSNPEVFAEGLRNSVGIVFHPDTGELFGTDNARDWLGDDLPPDEVNIIRQGKHYGWPFCYGRRVADPEFDRAGFCKRTEPPAMHIQAHSAPLGLRFYTGSAFPERYRGGLFVALHGSWNRSVPTGYKVITVPFKNGQPSAPYEDFITGWLKGKSKWGRPVDVVQGPGGDLFISDDYEGRIYRVYYAKSGKN
jgi:glucose/arabinose dehydrogenase